LIMMLVGGLLIMVIAICLMSWTYRKESAEIRTGKSYLLYVAVDFILDIATGAFSSLYGLYLIIFSAGLLMTVVSIVKFIH
jgi:hypothetical protein